MNLKIFLLAILFSCVSFSQERTKVLMDSIEFYLSNSENKLKGDFNNRLALAIKAKQLSEKLKADSLKVKSLMSLASVYSDNADYELFLKYSRDALKLAKNINDSISLAKINKSLGYYYYNKSVDSAYYYNTKAEKLFRKLQDKFNTAVVLLDIALLQYNGKDYTGSELTSVNALSLLDQLDDSQQIIRYKTYFYNNLGLVFKELSQFDESIKYHLKALMLKEQMPGDNRITIDNTKNNLANTYKNAKEFDLALNYYNQILGNENLIRERPGFYAFVLDNYAHTMYLSKNNNLLPQLYLKALRISDSIGDGFNSIPINLHLAEYYSENKNKELAKYYAYKAKNLSEPNFTDALLESLLVLSKIEEDSVAVKYYDTYIKLNDSLLENERSLRNKFARIRFETQKIEEENVQIARERMWLLIISVTLIITSFLIYVVINQRNKNKELKFIQKQQEANEEIYNLMLSQNENIEEARTLEKKRISEELHDGVLGRLFGTRLSLDSLNLSNAPDAIKTRGQYIDELKAIENDIRKVSHELNTDFVSGAGFIDIIKTLVDSQTKIYGLQYKLDYNEEIIWEDVSNKNKIHIYRIVQEALHNIYKHANATVVKISFKLKKDVICLIMKDNGSGFDVAKAKSGIGLKNMKSRINEINGRLEIMSEKETGTTVTIEVPTS